MLLNRSKRTVLNWCESGELRGKKIGGRWTVLRSSVNVRLAGLETPAIDQARGLLPELSPNERKQIAIEALTLEAR